MSSAQLLRLLHFHCSMPRPPNRRRTPRTRRRAPFADPSLPSPSPFSESSFSSDPTKLRTVIDLDLDRLSLSVSSNARLRRFLASADDALADLRTLVVLNPDSRRLIVSCRRSTLQFAGNAVLLACAVAVGFRVLLGLLSWLASIRRRSGPAPVVVRRDRSLGGREVVVSARAEGGRGYGFGGPSDPLSPALSPVKERETVGKNWVRAGTRLPKWWPSSEQNPPPTVADKEEYQRKADRLIRAITDNRMSGKDIVADDIIQLRQICRTSGVRVSFDTTNTRDSFYRTSVDFILNVCARAPSHSSSVQLAGEDIRQFIAGLAENIGLENTRAARIMSAAVAARTRSRFLQAWALEMQGKHAEAILELSTICLTLRIFHPEECSPEMEMVARGLEKHLKLEQREFLMDMLAGFCEEEIRRTAAEALGLMPFPTST